MATDVSRIVANLAAFHDLADQIVVAVGAGGGQLVEYARPVRRLIAVDRDEAAIERLAARARDSGLSDKFVPVKSDFLHTQPRGDVVLFEFCLHQMAEPDRALEHASRLAPEVLVLDHAPHSEWSWCAGEEKIVAAAWRAVASRTVRRQQDYDATQRFTDFAELEARLSQQGPESRGRIERYRGQTAISIPMPYRLALL
ncbi:MAG TPA: class I SAM-dependent methyltransferase [Thermoanaerobaculia bacterium]